MRKDVVESLFLTLVYIFRIVINMYEFIHQNDVLACKIFGVDWYPPRWARILNEVYIQYIFEFWRQN